MTRRGDKISALDALRDLGDLSDLVGGAEPAGPARGVVALPIEALVPDPMQARRVLPTLLRERFLAGQVTPVETLQAWQTLAGEDPLEAERLQAQVVRLARSLQAQAQINPVTVSRLETDDQPRYMIETGERRWWAHWWLVGVENEPRFGTIQAVVVETASPWRQAAENLQGEPLSAVGEACQVARLLLLLAGVRPEYALSWDEVGPRVGLGSEGTGYAFYRLALTQRAAQGAWSLIEQATGKGTRYCQYLLALLRLSDAALALADRTGLTESQLRPLPAAEEDPARQWRIVQLAAAHGLGRDEVAELVRTADLEAAAERLGRRPGGERPRPRMRPPEQIVLDRLSSMTRLLDRASRSEPAVLRVIAREIRQMEQAAEKRAELESLHLFLTELLALLAQREADDPGSTQGG